MEYNETVFFCYHCSAIFEEPTRVIGIDSWDRETYVQTCPKCRSQSIGLKEVAQNVQKSSWQLLE